MKLQVLQDSLSEALNTSSRFVSTRSQLPVLSNVKLEAIKTRLNITATNLETSYATSLGAKVEKTGEIAIPARVLTEIISNLKPGTLTLEAKKEKLEVVSEGFEGSLSGMNVSDFPAVPQTLTGESVSFPFDKFIDSLSKVLFSCSSDETRPVLGGVLFVFEEDSLTFVSTDGFRLSQYKIKTGKKTRKGSEGKMVVPKSVLSEISRLSTDKEGTLYFQVRKKDSQVIIGVGGSVLSSRLLEGEFPNFEKIIPGKPGTTARIDKEELKRAIKLAATFARDNSNIIKLEVGKNDLLISAKSSKSGRQEGRVDAKVEGEKIIVSFNYKFIEDFLSVVSGEEVEMGFTNVTSPGVFKDTSDPDYLHLIMPVKAEV